MECGDANLANANGRERSRGRSCNFSHAFHSLGFSLIRARVAFRAAACWCVRTLSLPPPLPLKHDIASCVSFQKFSSHSSAISPRLSPLSVLWPCGGLGLNAALHSQLLEPESSARLRQGAAEQGRLNRNEKEVSFSCGCGKQTAVEVGDNETLLLGDSHRLRERAYPVRARSHRRATQSSTDARDCHILLRPVSLTHRGRASSAKRRTTGKNGPEQRAEAARLPHGRPNDAQDHPHENAAVQVRIFVRAAV